MWSKMQSGPKEVKQDRMTDIFIIKCFHKNIIDVFICFLVLCRWSDLTASDGLSGPNHSAVGVEL